MLSYRLLDFGRCRKLERFGEVVLDRPCPAAKGLPRQTPAAWREPSVVRVAEDATKTQTLPSEWLCAFESLQLELKLTPFGHMGVFPEQAENWSWLNGVASALLSAQARAPRALNLFAYTGASTLVLARAGAEVVHVDASAPAVAWARRNAAHNQLDSAPVRWIVEDARKFVSRELRRGKRYDIVVLDPPTYGHGPKGRTWQIETDLPSLLEQCYELLEQPSQSAMLMTAHSETPSMRQCADYLHRLLGSEVEARRLSLEDALQRQLDCGFLVRFSNSL